MKNKDKLISILVTGLILVSMTGCKKQEEKITESVKTSLNKATTLPEKDEMYNDNLEVDNQNSQSSTNNLDNQTVPIDDANSNIDVVTIEDNNLSKDEIIINYFNEATYDINNLLSSDNVTNAKMKCKEYFITFVDFIFYDGKIKNITFSELKEDTKKQVITIVQKLDTLIMKKFPNYKETINETSKYLYDQASDLLHKTEENVEDYVESKVGEETYQDILNEIDEIKKRDQQTWNDMKDFGSDVYESGKDKVKNWYENFKNK